MLPDLKKAKLALVISSILFSSSLILAAVSIDKVINLQPGQSINVDNLMITCQSSTATTNSNTKMHTSVKSFESKGLDKNIKTYKSTKDFQNEFCASLGYQQRECMAIKVKHLEPRALDICSTIQLNYQKLECIKVIKDKVYSDKEIETIGKIYLDYSKIESFKKSGVKMVEASKSLKDIQDEFCSSLSYQKKECMEIKVKHLEPKALDICSTIQLDYQKLECIKVIKDKVYSDKEIETIDKIYLDYSKIESLKKSGSKIADI